MMDRDESVLEFFEQPDTFNIRYLDKSGKKMGGHYYTLISWSYATIRSVLKSGSARMTSSS